MTTQNNGGAFFAGVVIGCVTGASLALLLAPKTGEETRTQLVEKGVELKHQANDTISKVGHLTQDQVAVWQGQGKATIEHGKDNFAQVVKQGVDRVMEMVSDGSDEVIPTKKQAEAGVVEAVAAQA